jgi:hypothetical protein
MPVSLCPLIHNTHTLTHSHTHTRTHTNQTFAWPRIIRPCTAIVTYVVNVHCYSDLRCKCTVLYWLSAVNVQAQILKRLLVGTFFGKCTRALTFENVGICTRALTFEHICQLTDFWAHLSFVSWQPARVRGARSLHLQGVCVCVCVVYVCVCVVRWSSNRPRCTCAAATLRP